MTTRMITTLTALAAIPLFATAALAQSREHSTDDTRDAHARHVAAGTVTQAGATDTAPAAAPQTKAERKALLVPALQIDHMKPNDQRGINMFEFPKESSVPFTGFRINLGAAFTQQFQGLQHENTAAVKPIAIGHGFNNAVANLYLNAQLAKGVRVAMTSYLSSRHHNETWVKDGYFLIDESPIANPLLERIMQYTTLRIGHFEINYGDAHYRRTDNGNAMHNPFVGNLIMDAFTTEIGAEAYVRANGFIAMLGATGGELKGNLERPADRSPAFLGKVGFDRQLTKELRTRLTGSFYSNSSSPAQTLYAGDRAGSRYYYVLEPAGSTLAANFSSGLVNPGFRASVSSRMVNPFIRFHDAELFGTYEVARGKTWNGTTMEAADREFTQVAIDGVYRFMDDDAFIGARYNTVSGRLPNTATITYPGEVSVDRTAFGAGWFLTPTVLLKGEWVNQGYRDFPTADIRSGGSFKGFMIEGVVAF
jgi:hypothetical protein